VINNKRVLGIFGVILIVAAAFIAGTLYQKHRPAIKELLASLKSLELSAMSSIRAAVADTRAVSAAAALRVEQPANPGAPAPHTRRALDTSLLPLIVDTVAMPPALGVHAGQGGGITIVNDTIVIVDLKGSFFTIDAKSDKMSNKTATQSASWRCRCFPIRSRTTTSSRPSRCSSAVSW
jgi:hypothetical protein